MEEESSVAYEGYDGDLLDDEEFQDEASLASRTAVPNEENKDAELELSPDIVSSISSKLAQVVTAVESAFGHSPEEYATHQIVPSVSIALKELLRVVFLQRDAEDTPSNQGRRFSPVRFVAMFLRLWRRAQRSPAETSKKRERIIREVAEAAAKQAYVEEEIEKEPVVENETSSQNGHVAIENEEGTENS